MTEDDREGEDGDGANTSLIDAHLSKVCEEDEQRRDSIKDLGTLADGKGEGGQAQGVSSVPKSGATPEGVRSPFAEDTSPAGVQLVVATASPRSRAVASTGAEGGERSHRDDLSEWNGFEEDEESEDEGEDEDDNDDGDRGGAAAGARGGTRPNGSTLRHVGTTELSEDSYEFGSQSRPQLRLGGNEEDEEEAQVNPPGEEEEGGLLDLRWHEVQAVPVIDPVTGREVSHLFSRSRSRVRCDIPRHDTCCHFRSM